MQKEYKPAKFDTLYGSIWKEPLFWLKYVDLKHILQGLQAIRTYD